MSIFPNNAICFCCNFEFAIEKHIDGRPICPKCGKQAHPENVASVLYRQKLKLNKYLEVSEHQLKTYPGSGVKWDDFSYPFASYRNKYGVWTMNAVGHTEKLSFDDLFNLDILRSSEVYFHQVGEYDEEAWVFIIKRPDNIYVYFTASCDYTGFDCRGGGDIFYIKDDWPLFWNKCLDNSGRNHLYTTNKIRTIQCKGRTLTVIGGMKSPHSPPPLGA